MSQRASNATPKRWQQKVLDAVAIGATVTEAAKAAGVDRSTVWRKVQADAAFKTAFDDALEQGTDVIEGALTRRAVVGVAEPVIYQGKLMFVGVDKDGNECPGDAPERVGWKPLTVNKPSDVLGMFILKARKPERFRDNLDITSGGGPIKVIVEYGLDENRPDQA